jgi:hypothetical protein
MSQLIENHYSLRLYVALIGIIATMTTECLVIYLITRF